MKNSSLMTSPSNAHRTENSNSKNSARNRRKNLLVRDSGISAESGHTSQSESVRNFLSEDEEEDAVITKEKADSAERIHQPDSK